MILLVCLLAASADTALLQLFGSIASFEIVGLLMAAGRALFAYVTIAD